MSSQLSAQAITAQTAITRISIRRCSILPWQRGSPTTLRCRTRPSMDMILSSPARGHVIIHQARASDRNFMRLPCLLFQPGSWRLVLLGRADYDAQPAGLESPASDSYGVPEAKYTYLI